MSPRARSPRSRGSLLHALRFAPAVLAIAGVAAVVACGPDPVAPEACRQIEEARCRRAPACGLALAPPEHKDGSDIDACIRFYRDACLHGLAIGTEPGGVIVSDCVNAITTGDCAVVKDPKTSPQCGFLVPKPADTTTTDAATDATDAGGGG